MTPWLVQELLANPVSFVRSFQQARSKVERKNFEVRDKGDSNTDTVVLSVGITP